jgi:hypothetical protein
MAGYSASQLQQMRASELKAEIADLKRQLAEMKFIDDLLRFCIDHEIADMLFWFAADDGAPRPAVNANDLFAWACAEAIDITPDNFEMFTTSVLECKAIHSVLGAMEGCSLFACRVEKMRPQGAAYPTNQELWPLFDACGPERETGSDNPCKPGEYKSPPSYGDLQKQLAEAKYDNEKLNEMLRDAGYGQGSIDAYVGQCEEIDAQREHLNEYGTRIANLETELAEAKAKLEEQEGWIHSCPQCGEKCKECSCMEQRLMDANDLEYKLTQQLAEAREREAVLREALLTFRKNINLLRSDIDSGTFFRASVVMRAVNEALRQSEKEAGDE